MRHPGMVSPTKAAKLLDVCEATIRNWAQKALCGRESKLRDVHKNKLTGRLYIPLAEIARLKK